MNQWLKSTFVSLANRNFQILSIGTILSFVAFFMSMIVQSVVAFELEGTNTAVSLVVFAQGGGMMFFGPLGGALADRWPKRRVIAVCQMLTALVMLSISWLLSRNELTIEILSAGAFLMGTAFAFLGPARTSLVVDLVPEETRGNAMAVTLIANTTSRVMGPFVAGMFLGWPLAGAMGAYFAMAIFYAVSAVSLVFLPKSIVRESAGDITVFATIVEGMVYIWQHPRLRLLVTFFGAVIFIGFPHVTVLPGLIENVHGLDAKSISGLFGASAVGAVCASTAVARYADSPRALPIYSAMAVVFGCGLMLLAYAPNLQLCMLAMVGVGAGSGGFQALNTAVIAKATAPEFMGRVMSLTMMAFAGFGLMALPFGILADRVGEQLTLLLMGMLVVVISLVMGRALSRQVEKANGVDESLMGSESIV
ncbi:MAG: MFS family permease [Myxococcota bacterium]